MKVTLILDRNREEELIIYAHKESNLTDSIKKLVSEQRDTLIGYNEDEIIPLRILEIHCFTVESNKIYALTDNSKLLIKNRLYKIEESLPDSFVKINQSCIVNINKIERFSTAISGSLTVRLKNGYCDYVSRRNLKNVKERLGL